MCEFINGVLLRSDIYYQIIGLNIEIMVNEEFTLGIRISDYYLINRFKVYADISCKKSLTVPFVD